MLSRQNENKLDIVKAIKKGNKKAFETFFLEYYNNLTQFATLYTNDKFLSEEIVSEFFTDFWINRKKINIKTNVRSFLYVSIKNKAISKLRKSKREIIDRVSDYFDFKDDCSPEKKMIYAEQREKVKNVLDLIPPKSKEVFIMHRFDKLKYREIADILDISPRTVENHIARALRILREYYNN